MSQFTSAWLVGHLARMDRTGRTGKTILTGLTGRESELHEQVYDECRRRGWIALHGSMAERTCRTLGEPDFVILASGSRVLFVECKSRTGKLSPAQAALKFHAEKLGHTVHVVRSQREFLELVGTSIAQQATPNGEGIETGTLKTGT